MITRMRFKNWRSLRDVTIDNITPLTVFIGANSSGKSNILDALHFLRYALENGVSEAVYTWGGFDSIHHKVASSEDFVLIEVDFYSNEFQKFTLIAQVAGQFDGFIKIVTNEISDEWRVSRNAFAHGVVVDSKIPDEIIRYLMIAWQRWQYLNEGFLPETFIAGKTPTQYLNSVDHES